MIRYHARACGRRALALSVVTGKCPVLWSLSRMSDSSVSRTSDSWVQVPVAGIVIVVILNVGLIGCVIAILVARHRVSWSETTANKYLREHGSALLALIFLVAIGVSKTLLTKLIFSHSPTPVAFSVLSCVATNVCLLPILAWRGDFRGLSRKQLRSFVAVCVAIAVDLACQNVALSILSIALQQCIKATLPTCTVIVESLLKRKRFHPLIYATVIAICLGPIIVASQSSWVGKSDAGSAAGTQLFGAIMMIVAMLGGAFKYVLCHHAIKEFQREMGVLTFTFWVETFVGAMLLPWAILNGEAYRLLVESDQTLGEWVLLFGTGAFGGVRIVSQFLFLAQTSATSLAMSGIAMQVLTIGIGILLFNTPLTPTLAVGVLVTTLTSAAYAYLKTSKVLEKKPGAGSGAAKKQGAKAKLSQVEVEVCAPIASPADEQEDTNGSNSPPKEVELITRSAARATSHTTKSGRGQRSYQGFEDEEEEGMEPATSRLAYSIVAISHYFKP